MTRVIHYYQDIAEQTIDNEGNLIEGETKRVYQQVESNNEKDFQEQLATIKGYCGGDYTVEEIEPPLPQEDVIALAVAELYEKQQQLEKDQETTMLGLAELFEKELV